MMVAVAAMLLMSLSTTMTMAASERRGQTSASAAGGGWVVASEDNIYFVYQGHLCRTQEGSDQIQRLTPSINDLLPDPYYGNLNVMDGFIYFKTMHGSIYRVSEQGGNPELVLAGLDGPWIGVNEFIIVDDWIYYNYQKESVERARVSKLCRMSLSGGEEQVLLDNGDIHWLDDVNGGYLYYHGFSHDDDEFHMSRLSIETGQVEPFGTILGRWVVEGEWIYYLDQEDHNYLRRARLDGAVVEDIYVEASCSGIRIADDWIYCYIEKPGAADDEYQYVRMKHDGTMLQVLAENEYTYGGSVAGDVISSDMTGTYRIRENDQGIWLKKIEAGRMEHWY